MGNEDKVSDSSLIQAEFLPDEFINKKEKKIVYSLEKEFAASSKNKSYGIFFTVFLFLGLLIGVSVFASRLVQRHYENQELKFGTIDQLNLQELLSISKKNEQKLYQLNDELKDLKQQRTQALKNASLEEKAKTEAQYGERIKEKEEEIAAVKKDMESYDLTLKESVKHADEMINNYKKLSELQVNQLKQEYEEKIEELVLKYNPVFTDEEKKALLGEIGVAVKEKASAKMPEAFEPAENIMNKADYSRLKELIQNRDELMNRIQQIPYINSAGVSMDKLEELDSSIMSIYEKTRISASASLNAANSLINSYKYCMSLRLYGESGLIIDPRNADAIAVLLSSPESVDAGDKASVFRGEKEFIGTVEFLKSGSILYARAVSLAPEKSFLPMDKLRISRNQTETDRDKVENSIPKE